MLALALLALDATPGFFSLGAELVTLLMLAGAGADAGAGAGAALALALLELDATPGFGSLGADTDTGATLLTLAATLAGTLADANGRDPILDAARTTRGADTGSIDSGMTDRGRGRRADAMLGTTLLALTNAGAAMLGAMLFTLGAALSTLGATLFTLGAALFALSAALSAALALTGLISLCSSSCTIIDEEGATPGFLSFFGGSCDTSGAAFIEGATPGFLSFFGAAIGSSAIDGPSALGAIPGFLSFGAAISCSCAKRGSG